MKKLLLLAVILLNSVCIISSYNTEDKGVFTFGGLAEFAQFNPYRTYTNNDPNFDIYLRYTTKNNIVISVHQLNYSGNWYYGYSYYGNHGSYIWSGSYYEDEMLNSNIVVMGYNDIFMTDIGIGKSVSINKYFSYILQTGPTLIIPSTVVYSTNNENAEMVEEFKNYYKNRDFILNDYFGLNFSAELNMILSNYSIVVGIKFFSPLSRLYQSSYKNLSFYLGPTISF